MKRLNQFFIFMIALFVASSSCLAFDISQGGVNQEDLIIVLNNSTYGLQNRNLDPIGLAIATATQDVKTTLSTRYLINGKMYQFAAATIDLSALGATLDTQDYSTYRKYMISVNLSGTVTVNAGAASSYDRVRLPKVISGYTPIGYFKVLTGSTTNYTCGTTKLADTHLTVVYKNLYNVTSGQSGALMSDRAVIDVDTSSDSATAPNAVYNAATVTTLVAGTADINGGTIDGAVVGNSAATTLNMTNVKISVPIAVATISAANTANRVATININGTNYKVLLRI